MIYPIEFNGNKASFSNGFVWQNNNWISHSAMIHVCSWCEGAERETTKLLNLNGYHNISHGMCKKCFDNIIACKQIFDKIKNHDNH